MLPYLRFQPGIDERHDGLDIRLFVAGGRDDFRRLKP
jgi:hypothetical protein